MHYFRNSLIALGLSVSASAGAQLVAPVRSGDHSEIVVTGARPGQQKVEMSDWRMAETPHVIVFSKGPEKELAETAHKLEKLHFLLSVLLNRVGSPDDTIKMRVTMIGDSADFAQMQLGSARWQDGPYPRAFPNQAYYDPREDGSVAATTGGDVKIILQPPAKGPPKPNCEADSPGVSEMPTIIEVNPYFGVDLSTVPLGEISICQRRESRTYALFAQNYLLTHFPAAYPRWFLQGFGEIFATMVAPGDGAVEYGHPPPGLRKVMSYYGRYPLENVFSGNYLTKKDGPYDWTPYHAWALTHLLFFSEKWKAPLHEYLAAVANGRAGDDASKAFGDLGSLRSELSTYRGRKVPFERMTFPADRARPPVIRRLTKSEAGIVRGKLEIGARITAGPAEAMEDAAAKPLSQAEWLDRLRRNAERFPAELDAQLVLAEAECRSSNGSACAAAAARALALAPTDPSALLWKGVAEAQLALAGPASQRKDRMKAARALIVRSNRLDPEALLPLLAFYRTYSWAGIEPTQTAVAGLMKTVDSVPAAPEPRLLLAREQLRRGERPEARRTILPVARGAFDSPEKKAAAEVLREAEATIRSN